MILGDRAAILQANLLVIRHGLTSVKNSAILVSISHVETIFFLYSVMHGKKKHDLKISPLETTKMKAAAAHDLLKKTWTPAVLIFLLSPGLLLRKYLSLSTCLYCWFCVCRSVERTDLTLLHRTSCRLGGCCTSIQYSVILFWGSFSPLFAFFLNCEYRLILSTQSATVYNLP